MTAITTWLRSTAATLWGGVVLFIISILVVRLERYPEWDEAVFLSQSGGLNGISVAPMKLVESREIGPPTLISIIRSFVVNYANTKLVWLLISVVLIALGAALIGRHLKVPPALFIVIFGSYWIPLLFIGSFYGFYIGATAALIASACYLSLRTESGRQAYWGVALGASLSLALWFRQIESFLVLVCLLAHSSVVSPKAFWLRRIKGVTVTGVTVFVLFVVPWLVDSTIRFGSVGQRIRGAREQGFERGLSNQFSEYWQVITGESFHYAALGTTPSIARFSLIAFLFVLAVLSAWGYRKGSHNPVSSEDDVSAGAVPLMWTIGVVLVGFFTFYIDSVRDRYLLMGLIFLFAGALAGVWRLADVHLARLGGAIALTVLVMLWVTTNAVIAHQYEFGRFAAGRVTEIYAQMLHGLSTGRDCVGISRFGAPQVAFGSGCRTLSMSSPQLASERAVELREPGRVVFVWWPETEAGLLELSVDEWTALPRSDAGDIRQPVVMWWMDSSTN